MLINHNTGSDRENGISQKELTKLDAIIERYKEKRGYLIPALKEAQEVFGYLPHEVQCYLAVGLNIPTSHVYGVVSFYSFFTMEPRGRNQIKICLGTACYVKGAPEIKAKIQDHLGIKVGQNTPDLRFSLEGVRCLGACGLAPVMMVGDDTHAALEPGRVVDILESYE